MNIPLNIKQFIEKTDLEKTTLIGFYGGGNYGDELLLEVLCASFANLGVKHVDVAYRNLEQYGTFHKDYNYSLVNISDRKSFIQSLFRSKNIVIGGGGLWGMDVNSNILTLSFMLFICRWIFRKKVYLIGVGYYGSTDAMGHVSAFLAGKSANMIFARDNETYSNFRRFNKKTILDRDIALYIDIDTLSKEHYDGVTLLENELKVTEKTFLISLRRFQEAHKNDFTQIIEKIIKNNPSVSFIVMILEPRTVDEANYALITEWSHTYKNVQISDFNFNPIALFLFIKKYSDLLLYVGPQFHGIITAFINNVPFFPITYDNKVRQLISTITPTKKIIHIKDISYDDVQQFIMDQKGK